MYTLTPVKMAQLHGIRDRKVSARKRRDENAARRFWPILRELMGRK